MENTSKQTNIPVSQQQNPTDFVSIPAGLIKMAKKKERKNWEEGYKWWWKCDSEKELGVFC